MDWKLRTAGREFWIVLFWSHEPDIHSQLAAGSRRLTTVDRQSSDSLRSAGGQNGALRQQGGVIVRRKPAIIVLLGLSLLMVMPVQASQVEMPNQSRSWSTVVCGQWEVEQFGIRFAYFPWDWQNVWTYIGEPTIGEWDLWSLGGKYAILYFPWLDVEGNLSGFARMVLTDDCDMVPVSPSPIPYEICGTLVDPYPIPSLPEGLGGGGMGQLFIPFGKETDPYSWFDLHQLGVYVSSQGTWWMGTESGQNLILRGAQGYFGDTVDTIESYALVKSCGPTPIPPPSLLTATPASTSTPAPTPAPTPPLDTATARRWFDEKAVLISSLETADIPTDLFAVPGVRGYDESTARDLLSRLSAQLEQGKLTSEQLDALARLTIEERALATMLPVYTTIAASLTDVYGKSIETAIGVVFALRPAWNFCRSKLPFCGGLQEATEKTVWRLIRNSGKLAIRAIGPELNQRETAAKVWDLTVRLAQERLSHGQSLGDLLADNSIQAMGTALMIQPYLSRTQELINKGVRTADLSVAAPDRWAITGDTERAGLLIGELAQKADWEKHDALDRHQDFQNAADLAQIAEDLADLAALSPTTLLARAIGLGARLEHLFIVNLPLIYLNSQNLSCVEYLSMRAAEMAFDSAQPSEDCRYRQGMLQHHGKLIALAAYQPAPATHLLRSQLQDEANDYRRAVETLMQSAQAGDLAAVALNIEQLHVATESLGSTLETMQAIVLEHETLDQNDLSLIGGNNAFATANFALYLAIAEVLIAQQAGQQPQTDLPQIAQAALTSVDEIEQAATSVNLTPPAGEPVLVIQSVKTQITPDGQLQVDVGVSNVGTGDTLDVKVTLLVEEAQVGSQVNVGALKAGSETRIALSIPLPAAPMFTIQVWNQDILMDFRPESIPFRAIAPIESIATIAPASAPSSHQSGGGFCSSLFGASALPIVALIWSRCQRKRIKRIL
ncbi:MAG: hypothetical protein NZM42_11525 [Gemmatales bacterium]|nr:hypothetical protein [Gemmatales bacterium]MDW8224094.1 CARDB domain-containing protein [Gemmatales bacterium]